MPINTNITPVKLPMKQKFNQKPTAEIKNNLSSINISLVNAPSLDDLRSYLTCFAHATWSDSPFDPIKGKYNKDLDEIIYQVFIGKALPTALETVKLTFAIEGISLQEVTHILRYRTASFSAECSGDKWWTDKNILVPNSIQHSDAFYTRYVELTKMCKELYQDMIDSKKISIMDARYILNRNLETFYFMSISLKDAIHFIKQRIDKQIQPETDNIIAYQMYKCICDIYPLAAEIIDIRQPSYFYVNTARTGRATNLYFPDKDSDLFEYHPQDFIYQATRDQLNGTNEDATNLFNTYLNTYTNYFQEIKMKNRKDYAFLWGVK